MLDFAIKLTREPQYMEEEDVEELRQNGFGDTAIHHIVQVTALFNYYNRIADGLGIAAEDEWLEGGGYHDTKSRRALRDSLAKARKAIRQAQILLGQEVTSQGQRIEAAELGPHGHSDVIQARNRERDELLRAAELLESADEELEQAAEITSDLPA